MNTEWEAKIQMHELHYEGTNIVLQCLANRGWHWEVKLDRIALCSGEIAFANKSHVNLEESQVLAAEAAKLAVDVMKHNGKLAKSAAQHAPALSRQSQPLTA